MLWRRGCKQTAECSGYQLPRNVLGNINSEERSRFRSVPPKDSGLSRRLNPSQSLSLESTRLVMRQPATFGVRTGGSAASAN